MKMELSPGDYFGDRYVIQRKIGEGLFEKVYLANDIAKSNTVVLRISHEEDQHNIQELFNRFSIIAKLSHPQLIRVIDLIRSNGEFAVALEYAPGDSLENYLRAQATITHRNIFDASIQIAEALDYVHSNGLGFIDFTSQDIVIDGDSRNLTLKIISTDIKSAKSEMQENLIADNQIIFGALIYRALVGKESPFNAPSQPRTMTLTRPSLENPTLPQELDDILLTGLKPYFSLTYKSCTDFVRALFSNQNFTDEGNFVITNNTIGKIDDTASLRLREIAHLFPGSKVREIGDVARFDINSLSGSINVGSQQIGLTFEGLGLKETAKLKPGDVVDFVYIDTDDGAVAQQIQVILEAESSSDIRTVKNDTIPDPQMPNIVEVNKPLVSITDQPSGMDRLNFKKYVDAFAELVTNPELGTPITIGVYGQWGSGKSFLMGKVKEEIKERQKNKNKKVNIHVVEFNAWVYSGSEHLWASLVTHLYRDIEKHFGLKEQWLRLRKAIWRSLPKALGVFSFYALLGLAVSLLLNFNELQTTSDTLTLAINAFIGSIIGGSALASLPVLWTALREFFDSLFLSRAKNLQNLAARPDFRNQIGIMADIKAEIGFIREILKTGKKGKPTRLVLFIDDLDRCEHRKAVEVLQAIMLLLADEDGSPFVVFLGIDARVVVRAIEEHYGAVLVKAGINGYEYLDKIIQMPFVIPDSSQSDIENYVDSLLWESEAEKESILKKLAPTFAFKNSEVSSENQPASDMQEDKVEDLTEDLLTLLREPSEKQEKQQEEKKPETISAPLPPEEVPVTFTQAERETLKAHVSDLSSNPRKIKRIINIYRLTRLILPRDIDRTKAIRWILMTEQWPLHSAWIIELIESDAQTLNLFSDKSVQEMYEAAYQYIHSREMETLLSIDADPAVFEQFIKKEPVFTVREIRMLLPLTFNLNPAIRSEVGKQALKLTATTPEPMQSPEVDAPERSSSSYRLLPSQD